MGSNYRLDETLDPDRPETRQLVKLAQQDRREAQTALARLSIDEQVAVVCEAPVSQRGRLLELMPEPAEVIPRLPPAELVFTAKAQGRAEAGWLLEYASTEQLAAVFDLDGWKGLDPDPTAIDTWVGALVEAGDEATLRATRTMDPELLVLYLSDKVEVTMKHGDDPDFDPPDGSQTIDGVFYVVARDPKDDLAELMRVLQILFQGDYWLYFRMLQGTLWELRSDLEEWSRRWRTGRLEELGFPSWDESMRIYGFVRAEDRARLPEGESAMQHEEWSLPVWIPQLPTSLDGQLSLFRTVAELDAEERRAFFYAFIAIANKVAVADRMPLGDSETMPAAIAKAADVVSAGLDHVAAESGVAMTSVLRRAGLERLYRVGASLSPETTHPKPIDEADDETEDVDSDIDAGPPQ